MMVGYGVCLLRISFIVWCIVCIIGELLLGGVVRFCLE